MMEYKLAELFDLQMGKTPSRNNPLYWDSKDHAWVSIADLSETDGKYVKRTKEFLSDKAIAESGIKEIPKNTVIMSFKLSIGKVAITPEVMYSNEAIMAFIDKGIEKIIPDYLYYLFLHKNWNIGTNKAVMGITLNKKVLSDITIRLHSVKEQKTIISVLDKVYELLEKRKLQLQLLDNLIKARFVEMFGDPLTENNKITYQFIGEVAESIDPQPSHRTPPIDENGIPYVSIKDCDYLTGTIDFIGARKVGINVLNEQRNRYTIHDGDLIIGKIGTIGNPIFIPARNDYTLSANVVLIQPDKNKISPFFLKYSLMSPFVYNQFAEAKNSTTQGAFGIQKVRVIRIMNPSLKEQYTFETFAKQIDKSKVVNIFCVA